MSMHCAFLRKHHPLSKGLLYVWKGPLLYKNLNHTILSHTLSQGLLCVLKATFSKGCYTLLKGILCINAFIYMMIMLITIIISYSEFCYLKMILYFPNEYFFEGISHNTIVQINISWSHQVLSERNAAFLKNTNVYANYIFQKCYPSQKGLLQRSLWKGWHIFRKYMEDKTHLF